jgi:hypothetical protein
MERRASDDMWHLTIDDLLAAPAEAPRLAGPGPFVISLSASTAPVAVPANGFPEYPHLKVYEIKRNEDGRIRYRLRLGPIATDLEADAILSAVRERYPSAFATSIEQEDRRPLKLSSPPKEQSAPPVTEKPAAPVSGQVKCLSELISADTPGRPREAHAKAPAKPANGVASAPNGAVGKQPAKVSAPAPESGVFAIDFDHFLPPIEEHFKEASAPKSPKAASPGSHSKKPHGKGHGHGKGHSHGKQQHGKQQHSKHAQKTHGAPKAQPHTQAAPAPEHQSKHASPANTAVSTPAPVASAPAAKAPAASAPVTPAAKSVAVATPPAVVAKAPASAPVAEAQKSPPRFAEPSHDPNAVTDQVAILTLPQDSSGELTVDDAVESMVLVQLDPKLPDVEMELELHQEPAPAGAQPAAATPPVPMAASAASPAAPAAGAALEAVADIETDVVTLTEVVTGIATITTRALPEGAPAPEVPTLTEVVGERRVDESGTDLESIVARNNAMVDQLEARDVVVPQVETASAAVATAPAVAATVAADEADVPELSLEDAVPVVARKHDAASAKPAAETFTEVEFDELPLSDVRSDADISIIEAAALELADVDAAVIEADVVEKDALAAIDVAAAEATAVEIAAARVTAVAAAEIAEVEADATDATGIGVAAVAVAAVEIAAVEVAAIEVAAVEVAAPGAAIDLSTDEAGTIEVAELEMTGIHPQVAEPAPIVRAEQAAAVRAEPAASGIEASPAIELESTETPPVNADRTPRRIDVDRTAPVPAPELELAPDVAPVLKNPANASTTAKGTRSAPAVIDEPLVVEPAEFPASTPASEPSSRPEAFSRTARAADNKPATRIEPVEPRAATNTRLEEPATARSAAAASDRSVAPAAPAATPAEKNAPRVEILADPLPEMDSTQTIRELTQLELADADASRWFAIQLSLTEEAASPEDVPHLDIFDAYRLYSVAGLDKVGFRHALRLGFFTDQSSAEMVAGYLRSFFEGPEVKRVSQAERDRFANRRMVPKLDVGATGQHTIIELATAPTVPQRRLSDIARKQGKEPADSGSLWSRLVAPLKR